jgi:hypothetical protein
VATTSRWSATPSAVAIAQPPEVRHVGEPDVALADEDPRRDAVGELVEAVGEDGRGLDAAVAVAIAQQPDPLALLAEVVDLVARVFPDHRHAVGDRPARQVVLDPVGVVAHVEDLLVAPERFHDVAAAARVDVERDQVRAVRLGGEELDLEAGRHHDPGEGARRVAVVRLHLGRVARARGEGLGREEREDGERVHVGSDRLRSG